MPVTDIMIDLETLGTEQDCAFISIGACHFNRFTGKIYDTFYTNVDWNDALKQRSVTGDTLKWWFRQNKNAIAVVLDKGVDLYAAMSNLTTWIKSLGGTKTVWGNGATFDIAILENAYRQLDTKAPWQFWNVRDVRTIVDLAKGLVSKEETPFEGDEHNALHDAIHQAKYTASMISLFRYTT